METLDTEEGVFLLLNHHLVLQWFYNNKDKKWKDDFTNQTGGGWFEYNCSGKYKVL